MRQAALSQDLAHSIGVSDLIAALSTVGRKLILRLTAGVIDGLKDCYVCTAYLKPPKV